jgi:hypothetical protein
MKKKPLDSLTEVLGSTPSALTKNAVDAGFLVQSPNSRTKLRSKLSGFQRYLKTSQQFRGPHPSLILE